MTLCSGGRTADLDASKSLAACTQQLYSLSNTASNDYSANAAAKAGDFDGSNVSCLAGGEVYRLDAGALRGLLSCLRLLTRPIMRSCSS